MHDLLHGILARHTGQTVEKIAEDFDRDYFMDATRAVEYGLIDEVLHEEEEQKESKKKEKNGAKES